VITADVYLLVLNDMEPLDLASLEIVVITHGSDQLWNNREQRFQDVSEPSFWPFAQGEILVLTDYGREPLGAGRKPGKWDVHAQTCGTFAEALALSEQVKAAPAKFTSARAR
jgi:hypothetical protein